MLKSANVGSVDRVIRIALGLVLIALPYLLDIAWWTNPVARWASIVVGLVLVATAVFRFCPLYRLLGMNTCQVR